MPIDVDSRKDRKRLYPDDIHIQIIDKWALSETSIRGMYNWPLCSQAWTEW